MALDAMPQIPPALAALFAQRAQNPQAPGVPGSPAITPPAMTGGPAAPMRNVFGMPQGTGMFQKPAAPSSPPASDDPALQQGALAPQERVLTGGAQANPMLDSSLPKLPDTSALTAERQKISDIENKIASIPTPHPDDYKPSFWRRVLSIPIATAAGLNNPVAGAQASENILYGRYHAAQDQYQAQVSPLQRQLQAEREVGVPLAESEARLAQENFTNRLSLTREQREQTAFQNETGDKIFQETGADGQVHYYQTTKGGVKREVPEPREQAEDRRKREEYANTPAPGARPEPEPIAVPAGAPSAKQFPDGHQLKMNGKVIAVAKGGEWVANGTTGKFRVRTKSGGYIPYNETIEEGAQAGNQRDTALFDRIHPGRESKADPQNPNGPTAAEEREIRRRSRPHQDKIAILQNDQKTLSPLQRLAPDDETANKLKEIDKQIADEYAHIDAIEDEVMSRRTSNKKAGPK